MKTKILRILPCIAGGVLLTALSAQATPYASGLTNNGNGTMSFYINESGGNVTITYEDSSVNPNFNGTTTGTNLSSGVQTFSLGSHTGYTISVYKVGAGAPTLINSSPAFTPRGVAVNTRPASPYFGRVYADASSAGGIYAMNADLSLVFGGVRSAGVSWANNGLSPYRLSVASDDFLMVGDASSANAGVFRIDPNITSNQVFLGPIGETAGLNAGVFGTVQSKPLVFGDPSTGPVTLMQVDGDFPAANGYNSLLIYSNITLASLPYETAPTVQGPEVGLNLSSETLGDNEYPGLVQGPNGYIYASTYRNNLSNPLLQIYDPNTFNQIWNSYYNNNTADYFLTTSSGLTQGLIDIAVSADGLYVVGVTIDNWFVICPLTNGIPNTTDIFLNTPTSYVGNGRGVAMDAADNVYLSSSGIGLVQSWTLGLTTTANTTGNTNGSTGFQLMLPDNVVSVVAVTNVASQGGVDGTTGTPIPGSFLLTRTNAANDYTAPATIYFSLTGTATNGVYTVLPAGITPAANNSIVLPVGVSSTNITIVPTTNNVPRVTTTVILTVLGGSTYSPALPNYDTVSIINTSTNEMILSAGAATMYKAFSNDYASATITRLGDTNVSVTVPASAFTYSGTAVPNTDFVPVPALTFSAGIQTLAAEIMPLSNGVPPVDTVNPLYAGNKNVTVTLTTSPGAGYITTAVNTALTLIDNANPPGQLPFISDPLTNADDAANWNITFASVNTLQDPNDYNVFFGYDITTNNPNHYDNGAIGLPPSGATNALRINACQNLQAEPEWAGGVNVYYTNKLLSGNFAVRLYMNNVQGYGNASDENDEGGPVIGINHSGTQSNWWFGSGPGFGTNGNPTTWSSDGIWYWVDVSPGGPVGDDYQEFVGGSTPTNTGWIQEGELTYSSFSTVYKDPQVFTTYLANTKTHVNGDPANISPLDTGVPVAADNNWVDVELKQINGVVTFSMDKTPIFVYTNTTIFTNGYLMLGYGCPFMGIYGQAYNSPDQAVYFSDLTVVELGPDITVEPPATLTVGAGSNALFQITTAFASSAVTNRLYTAAGVAVGSPVVVAAPGGPATVTLVDATTASNGNYVVVVSDASGAVTSSIVALTVIGPPFITTQPASVTNNIGATVSFTVTNNVAGTAPFTYQWYSNNVALINGGQISGATAATLSIASINPTDQASYKVVVSNFAGISTSSAATLTTVIPPAATFTTVGLNGAKAILTFTTGDPYDATNSFVLQSSTNLAANAKGGFVNVTNATFTLSSGVFTVMVPTNGAATFYRLLQTY